MSDQPVRIGIVGDGPTADAYATAGPVHGVEVVRANAATVLADAAISGVICTDLAATLEALGRGKAVLVDAVALGSLEQLDQVQAAADAAGAVLVVAHPWRFHPVAQSFRATVDAGDLGPPALFYWIDEVHRGWAADGWTPAAGPATGAGIDLALWLLGAVPSRVYARPTAADGVTISIRFEDGANALIEDRRPPVGGGNGYGFAWLLGPRGEVRWDQRADGVSVRGDRRLTPSPDLGVALRAQIAHAIACWTGREDSAATVTEARRLLRATEAANESVRLGRPVTVGNEGAGR